MAYVATTMSNGVTTVDCQKQVRSWRLLRSIIEFLIPTCNCTLVEENQYTKPKKYFQNYPSSPIITSSTTTITLTGTILGYRKGKVSFCIQTNPNSTNPILFLELAIPTSVLAEEMKGGTLRIVLESCNSNENENENENLLFSTPLWTMYCNGRKVGYAVKRRPSKTDFEALRLMKSVSVGTGVIDHELMYLRANFQRVRASSKSNSQSFHLIDPEGNIGQELSIFFFRSK